MKKFTDNNVIYEELQEIFQNLAQADQTARAEDKKMSLMLATNTVKKLERIFTSTDSGMLDEAIDLLLTAMENNKINLDLVCARNRVTIWHYLGAYGKLSALARAIRSGHDVQKQDINGRTPWYFWLRKAKVNDVATAIEAGVFNPNTVIDKFRNNLWEYLLDVKQIKLLISLMQTKYGFSAESLLSGRFSYNLAYAFIRGDLTVIQVQELLQTIQVKLSTAEIQAIPGLWYLTAATNRVSAYDITKHVQRGDFFDLKEGEDLDYPAQAMYVSLLLLEKAEAEKLALPESLHADIVTLLDSCFDKWWSDPKAIGGLHVACYLLEYFARKNLYDKFIVVGREKTLYARMSYLRYLSFLAVRRRDEDTFKKFEACFIAECTGDGGLSAFHAGLEQSINQAIAENGEITGDLQEEIFNDTATEYDLMDDGDVLEVLYELYALKKQLIKSMRARSELDQTTIRNCLPKDLTNLLSEYSVLEDQDVKDEDENTQESSSKKVKREDYRRGTQMLLPDRQFIPLNTVVGGNSALHAIFGVPQLGTYACAVERSWEVRGKLAKIIMDCKNTSDEQTKQDIANNIMNICYDEGYEIDEKFVNMLAVRAQIQNIISIRFAKIRQLQGYIAKIVRTQNKLRSIGCDETSSDDEIIYRINHLMLHQPVIFADVIAGDAELFGLYNEHTQLNIDSAQKNERYDDLILRASVLADYAKIIADNEAKLSFGEILIIARMYQLNLQIHSLDKYGDIATASIAHNYGGDKETIHILYHGGKTQHYSKLFTRVQYQSALAAEQNATFQTNMRQSWDKMLGKMQKDSKVPKAMVNYLQAYGVTKLGIQKDASSNDAADAKPAPKKPS